MKLKTILRKDDYQGRAIVDYIEGAEVDHDAAAAHALMMAMSEYPSPIHVAVIEMLRRRADELMAEWGFDTGEGA